MELTFESSPTSGVEALAFRLRERVSRPFVLEVFVVLDSPVSLKELVHEKASLKVDWESDEVEPVLYHGIISSAELAFASDEGFVYRLVVSPKLWQLSLIRRSWVYTNKTVQQALEATLDAGGLTSQDFSFSLSASYEPEPQITQHKEDLLTFLQRWTEREGIYYYFEQGEEQEVVVFTDTKEGHELCLPSAIPYIPSTSIDVSAGISFNQMRAERNLSLKTYKQRSYAFTNPSLELSGESTGDDKGAGTCSVHDEPFLSSSVGQRLAQVRAEEASCLKKTYHLSGSVPGLRAGAKVQVDHAVLSDDTVELLIVEHVVSGQRGNVSPELWNMMEQLATVQGTVGADPVEGQDILRCSMKGIDSSVQYRAPRLTPWAEVMSVERGNVEGPGDSPYAQLDDGGSYVVKKGFDDSTAAGEDASVRMRMLQPHAGTTEGWHMPLRKATEVAVGCWAGNPDVPILMGVLPNLELASPVNDVNCSQNVVQTGSCVRMEHEDLDGSGYTNWLVPCNSTQLHMGLNGASGKIAAVFGLCTDATHACTVGCDQYIQVEGTRLEIVGGKVTEQYDSDQDTTVSGAVTEICPNQETTVTKKVTDTHQAMRLTIAGQCKEEYEDLDSTIAGTVQLVGKRSHTVSGDTKHDFDSPVIELVGVRTTTMDSLEWTAPGGIIKLAGMVNKIGSGAFTGDKAFHLVIKGTCVDYHNFDDGEESIQIGLFGAKAEAVGAAVALTGLKVELCGDVQGKTGISTELNGININLGATINKKWALKIFV